MSIYIAHRRKNASNALKITLEGQIRGRGFIGDQEQCCWIGYGRQY